MNNKTKTWEPKYTRSEIVFITNKKPSKKQKEETWNKRKELLSDYIKFKRKACEELSDIIQQTKTIKDGNDEKVKVEETSARKLNTSIPSILGFSVAIGTSKQIVYTWGEEDNDFKVLLDSLRELSEQTLVEALEFGFVSDAYGKFILGAKHNYREKTDITSNEETLNIIIPPVVADRFDIKKK